MAYVPMLGAYFMLKRVITSVIGLIILLPSLIFADSPLLCLYMAILAAVAVYEMLSCIGVKRNLFLSVPFLVFAFASPFAVRYYPQKNGVFLSAVLIILFYTLFVCVLNADKTDLADAALSFTMTLYIAAGFSAVVMIKDAPFGIGKTLFFLIFVTSWITDTLAYFSGMLFGKHKLIPKISPKKTVEGAIGGIVGNILVYLLIAWIIHAENYVGYLIMGLVTSVVSQVGDLIASLIKRRYGVKDYGKVLPGHGGVMDRFDSLIAVSIFSFFVMTILAGFNIF